MNRARGLRLSRIFWGVSLEGCRKVLEEGFGRTSKTESPDPETLYTLNLKTLQNHNTAP